MTEDEIKAEIEKIKEELNRLYEVVLDYMNQEKIITKR